MLTDIGPDIDKYSLLVCKCIKRISQEKKQRFFEGPVEENIEVDIVVQVALVAQAKEIRQEGYVRCAPGPGEALVQVAQQARRYPSPVPEEPVKPLAEEQPL